MSEQPETQPEHHEAEHTEAPTAEQEQEDYVLVEQKQPEAP